MSWCQISILLMPVSLTTTKYRLFKCEKETQDGIKYARILLEEIPVWEKLMKVLGRLGESSSCNTILMTSTKEEKEGRLGRSKLDFQTSRASLSQRQPSDESCVSQEQFYLCIPAMLSLRPGASHVGCDLGVNTLMDFIVQQLGSWSVTLPYLGSVMYTLLESTYAQWAFKTFNLFYSSIHCAWIIHKNILSFY